MPIWAQYILAVTIAASSLAFVSSVAFGGFLAAFPWSLWFFLPPLVVLTLPPLPLARLVQGRLAEHIHLPTRIIAYAAAFIPCFVWSGSVAAVGLWTGYMTSDPPMTVDRAILWSFVTAALTSIIVSLSLPTVPAQGETRQEMT